LALWLFFGCLLDSARVFAAPFEAPNRDEKLFDFISAALLDARAARLRSAEHFQVLGHVANQERDPLKADLPLGGGRSAQKLACFAPKLGQRVEELEPIDVMHAAPDLSKSRASITMGFRSADLRRTPAWQGAIWKIHRQLNEHG
jgi:hypothetical protein